MRLITRLQDSYAIFTGQRVRPTKEVLLPATTPTSHDDRRARNLEGLRRGFGTCPHCGDSWAWKPTGPGITYRHGSGMMLCAECHAEPTLHIRRILNALMEPDAGWDTEAVAQVEAALTRYNAGDRSVVWPGPDIIFAPTPGDGTDV